MIEQEQSKLLKKTLLELKQKKFYQNFEKLSNGKQFQQSIKVLNEKKQILHTTRRILGIMIIGLSLVYLEYSHKNYVNIFLETFILNFITFLTLLSLFTRIISKIFHIKLLKTEGFYSKDVFMSNFKFIILLLIQIVHPNILFRNSIIDFNQKYPMERLPIRTNYAFIAFQNTFILIELYLRELVPFYIIKEKQRYFVRVSRLNPHTIHFLLKFMFANFPFYVIFLTLFFCHFALTMLFKIVESRLNFYHPTQEWFIASHTTALVMLNSGFLQYYPKTNIGKMITLASAFIGFFIFSLLVVGALQFIDYNERDYKKYLSLEKEVSQQRLRESSGKLISLFLKSYFYYKQDDKQKYRYYLNEFENQRIQFKRARKICKNMIVQNTYNQGFA